MRTPAFAFAWQLWRRHHVGLSASLATLALMSLTYPALFAWNRSESVLLASVIPAIGVVGYLMNLFLFSDQVGDLSGRYPRRMLTLPVPTRTLVLWPMLYCA